SLPLPLAPHSTPIPSLLLLRPIRPHPLTTHPSLPTPGKNGVYHRLVGLVRAGFEEADLVRVDCKGMNKSDYKKIGAKLRDLLPQK
ncbi:unnamed protein product, partial [Closterium sp. NIES-54]